jgi:AmiR/NasT family two-component response regulator
VHHLNEALASRQAIGEAIGVLIERYKLDEQAAFNFLARLSSHSNTKLRDVASAWSPTPSPPATETSRST